MRLNLNQQVYCHFQMSDFEVNQEVPTEDKMSN